MLFEILNKLEIKYELLEHEAVYTVDEAKELDNMLEGIGCKNLFLTNKKDKYFLVMIHEDKRANIKEIESLVDCKHLSFGKEEDLKEVLGLEAGSCTPLGIINDKDNKVLLVFDKDLVDKKILCHPNRNTATLALVFSDLIKFIEYLEHKYLIYVKRH